MKFYKIEQSSKVYPGEYLLHQPTMQIVVCGAYNWDEDMVRCLSQGKLMEDKVENFKKIKLHPKEHKEMKKGISEQN